MRSNSGRSGRKGNPGKGKAAAGGSRFQRRVNDSKGRGSKSSRPDWQPKDSRSEPAFRTRGGARAGDARDDRRGGRREADDRGGRRDDFRSSSRGSQRDRNERGGYRDDRGFRGDRRDDRGYRSDRNDRRNDRDDRGYRSDRRDDRGGRFERDDRRSRDDRGGRRNDGGFRNDRNDRGDRGFRNDWNDRGFRNDRGERNFRKDRNDGGFRTERRNDRDFRGAERSERHPRTDRTSRHVIDDTVHEKLEATAIDSATIASDFASLGLGDGIVRALAAQGVTSPFPIQSGTIPASIEGRHVLGRASTGSGKTVAFGAPLVERLMRTKSKERRVQGRSPRALIVAPTRELAEQINRTLMGIAREVGLFTVLVTGGVSQQSQVSSLQKGVDIVIGTPGRMEDLIDQGRLNLGRVEIAVLDEADHMAELGFIEPVGRLLRQTHPESQKLLFSATLDKEVESLVKEFLTDPAIYEAADLEQANDQVEHTVLVADRHDKDAVLANLAAIGIKSVFFTRTRAYADRLADQFAEAGIRATAMHGDLSQARRTRGLEKLRRGKVDVLVATDVAARGIHVDEIELVVQADPPDDHKAYVHRAGRTGRAGASGHVVTVIAPSRRRRMQELLERADREVVMIPVDATSDLEGMLGLGR